MFYRHAPIKKVKITRPIAPWMKDPKIVQEYGKLNVLRNHRSIDKKPY